MNYLQLIGVTCTLAACTLLKTKRKTGMGIEMKAEHAGIEYAAACRADGVHSYIPARPFAGVSSFSRIWAISRQPENNAILTGGVQPGWRILL